MRWHRFTKRAYVWMAGAMLLFFAIAVIHGCVTREGIGLSSAAHRLTIPLGQ